MLRATGTMKNNNDIDKLLRKHLTPDTGKQSGGSEAEIDFNLLARYKDGTTTPGDEERITVLRATDPAFAELVEVPGEISREPARVIPFRRRWLPIALRYAACFIAVLIGSVYLYQRFGPQRPGQGPFITQKPAREPVLEEPLLESGVKSEEAVLFDDSTPGKLARKAGPVIKEGLDEREKTAEISVADVAVDHDLADKESFAVTGQKRDMQVMAKKSVREKGLQSSISTSEELSSYGTSVKSERDAAVLESKRAVAKAKSTEEPVVVSKTAKTKTAPEVTAASMPVKSGAGVGGAVSRKTELAEIRAESRLKADNTCALFIGIDTYKPEQAGVAPLGNAVVDMNNVQVAMNDFPFADVKTLSNDQATRENIDKSIRELRRTAGTNGSILIYYNGQGVQFAEQPDQQFLVPADGSIRQPDLFDNNISVDTLNNDAAAAPILNTYVVLDCDFQPVPDTVASNMRYNRVIAGTAFSLAVTNQVFEDETAQVSDSSVLAEKSAEQERRRVVKDNAKIYMSNVARLSYSYTPLEREITGEDIANFVASNESVRIQQAPVQQMLRRYRQVEQRGRNYIFYRASRAEPSEKE